MPIPMKQAELFIIPAETIAGVSIEEVEASYRDMEELGIAKLPYPKIHIRCPESGAQKLRLLSMEGPSSNDEKLRETMMEELKNSHEGISRWSGPGSPATRHRISTVEDVDRFIADRRKERKELRNRKIDLTDGECHFEYENEKLVDAGNWINGKLNRYPYSFNGELTPEQSMDNLLEDIRQRYGDSGMPSDYRWRDNPMMHEFHLLGRAERVHNLLIVLLATKNAIKTRVENKRLLLGIGRKNPNNYRFTTTITIPPPEALEAHSEGDGSSPRPHLRRGHIRRQRHGPRNSLIKRIWIEPCFVNADETFVSSRTSYFVDAHLPLAGLTDRQQLAEQLPRAQEILDEMVVKLKPVSMK